METKIRKLIHKYKSYFLDLLAPRNCAGCNKKGEILCQECLNLSFKLGGSCVFCNQRNNTGRVCKECRKKYEPAFEQSLWAGKYTNALKNAVWEFKYKKRKELAKPFGELIFKKFREYYPNYAKENFLIIPVPLHPKKEHGRGFNQAELIASEFSRLSNIQLLTHSLLKVVDTKTQVETRKKEERIKNLDCAFSLSPHYDPNLAWVNSTIILIDDVATTGATFVHASRALRKSCASKIIALAVAHGYG